MKRYLSLIMLSICTTMVMAQEPDTVIAVDTINNQMPLRQESRKNVEVKEIDTYADRFVPRKASLYSAILPGMGQAYNKNYWKIPIIYGGFFALGYAVNYYDDRYKTFRKELFTLLEEGGNTTPLGLSEDQVRSLVDKSRRERDFYMIMTGVLYLLQIAEAHIDAHLKEFKLNPDLKVSVEPMFERPQFANYNAGLSIKLKF
ncbi:MAG: DUF5683 domain-containing protein [Fulvivirga sp.]